MLFKRCSCADARKCRHPYWYEFTLYGARYRRSTRTANRQTADRIEAKDRTAALEHREGIAPPKIVKLSAHIADYVAYTAQHNTTAYKDKPVLDYFLSVVGDRPLTNVSPFDIDKWKLARAKTVSRTTVNRELNIVRGCFSRAVEWKRLLTSPTKGVDPFVVDDQRIRVLTDDELRLVLTSPNTFVALVCRVTLESLARLSEVLSIRLEHIGPTWVEFRRKGGAVTRAAITPDTRVRLLARLHQEGAVFGEGVKGNPPTEQTASRRIVRELQRLGIQDASHHTMRHTGVTLMLERGENPRAIQRLAGWGSLRMLERYGHARDASMRQAVAGNAAHLDAVMATPQKAPQQAAESS